ncbi:MAG: hypothetical protein AMXMBFR83_05910 [Phycisphaerae bacterium]|jgi:hypothetical protein
MPTTGDDRLASAAETIALTLGAIYASRLEDGKQTEKAEALRRCGFSNEQIGTLLGCSAHSVRGLFSKKRRRERSR